jgi:hypothetical protein
MQEPNTFNKDIWVVNIEPKKANDIITNLVMVFIWIWLTILRTFMYFMFSKVMEILITTFYKDSENFYLANPEMLILMVKVIIFFMLIILIGFPLNIIWYCIFRLITQYMYDWVNSKLREINKNLYRFFMILPTIIIMFIFIKTPEFIFVDANMSLFDKVTIGIIIIMYFHIFWYILKKTYWRFYDFLWTKFSKYFKIEIKKTIDAKLFNWNSDIQQMNNIWTSETNPELKTYFK